MIRTETQSTMRIGEAARVAGITTQQLQYYLMLGVVEASDRSSGRQRLFDRRAVERIKLVHLLNRSGYGLREIREIFMKRATGRS
ncbi:MAG: MerR family transcriptional regulator [Phycisphaeraceae bacterium]|nr:MerR family transcriptional regulator [Phycisphaeraceae bacterium]